MIISDLHIHSRFSRACSKNITIDRLEESAKIKGVDLLGTGDFTHPKWIKEVKEKLTEDDTGILRTKNNFPFLLQSEISLMYSQDGKGRKVHHVILAPSLEVVDQITEMFLKRGRVDYDGRPIFGMSSIELLDNLRQISHKIEMIPAHCLLPSEKIITKDKIENINEIKKNDYVLTHTGNFRKVLKTLNREYKGKIINIIPWHFGEGLTTTLEHPYYAIKSYKNCSWTSAKTCKPICKQIVNCKKKPFLTYKKNWVQAQDLEVGDIILYPIENKIIDKKKVKIGKKKITINEKFCRFIGYFLAEGYCNNRDAICFTFNEDERNYIQEVIMLSKEIFNIKTKKGKSHGRSEDIILYSKDLYNFFKKEFYVDGSKAIHKKIPNWILFLPQNKQNEIILGWWRGDKGSTSSINLANGIKRILLRLGIIPSITVVDRRKHKKRIGTRKINVNSKEYNFNVLTFIKDKTLLKYKEFKKFKRKVDRSHAWIDKNYIYLPIRKIKKKNYEGQVFNLEIEKDNSYCSFFSCVHNCWTPWFGIFGSNSGFDTLKQCFQEKTKHIHAIETGLSSDLDMNWRLSQLDKINLVSFSDMHSYHPWRLGREATMFDCKLTYDNILKAIRTRKGLGPTVEVEPAYGKYHWDGHRNCNVSLSPKKTEQNKGICPKCKKPVTIGVESRVEQLADREEGYVPKNPQKYYKLIPLSELISLVVGKGIATKTVAREFDKLLQKFNNEFNILLNVKKEELQKVTTPKLASIILKNREGKLKVKPGYDGVYGEVLM